MDILDLETQFLLTESNDTIKNLNISESNVVIDEYWNRLLVNKINIHDKKAYIQTPYLKIKNIITNNNDNIAYKIVLESTDDLINFLNNIDEQCKLLLENFKL